MDWVHISWWLLVASSAAAADLKAPSGGIASWYGEAHRGKPMANGAPFDPEKLTAASWFYSLGTELEITYQTAKATNQVIVTVTDRGPARRLVAEGRVVDLSRAAFQHLAPLELGLIQVRIRLRPGPECRKSDDVAAVPIHGCLEPLGDAVGRGEPK